MSLNQNHQVLQCHQTPKIDPTSPTTDPSKPTSPELLQPFKKNVRFPGYWGDKDLAKESA